MRTLLQVCFSQNMKKIHRCNFRQMNNLILKGYFYPVMLPWQRHTHATLTTKIRYFILLTDVWQNLAIHRLAVFKKWQMQRRCQKLYVGTLKTSYDFAIPEFLISVVRFYLAVQNKPAKPTFRV